MLKSIYNKEQAQPLYFNRPQLISHLVSAPEEYNVWGRGTGKSEGVLAPRSYNWLHRMPRATIVFVAATYQQHLTRTLPAIIKGWERLGFVRDRDYFIGRYAPKTWGWERPFFAPVKTDYFIHTRFGSGIHLVSQDRPGSANGISIDCIAGDEAKFLRQDRYEEELLPAMRGNRHVFGHLDCWNNILLTTDMPVAKSSQWILKKELLMDRERVNLILQCQLKIMNIHKRAQLNDLTKHQLDVALQEINKYQRYISKLRKGGTNGKGGALVYYSEASSYENIDVLGEDYFDKQQRNMTPFNFQTSIENKRPSKDQQSFYPDLDETVHGYTNYNNSYLENLNYDLDKAAEIGCRQDSDLQLNEPLHIGMDYGGSFNCLCVGQFFHNQISMINALHVSFPEKVKHLVLKFKKYYQHHTRKQVVFYYDHTAIGISANSDFSYAQEVIDLLQEDDEFGAWSVQEEYIGQTPAPDMRYEMWGKLLKDSNPMKFRYNRMNCEHWEVSCMNAPLKQDGDKIKKDKSSEKKKPGKREYSVPQEEATHLSDAGDTLLHGMLNNVDTGSNYFAF